jgi:homoserine acetyltransferase
MPQVKVAYETYCRLAADGRNTALITRGYTSSRHAAGRDPANDNLPGWWDGLRQHQPADRRALWLCLLPTPEPLMGERR